MPKIKVTAPPTSNGRPVSPATDDSGAQTFLPPSASSVNLNEQYAANAMLRRVSQRVEVPEAEGGENAGPPPMFGVGMGLLRQGASAVVDDSFTRCFKSQKRVAWNWNIYLFPFWCLGVVVRYTVLFPVRLLCLLLGFSVVGICFPLVKLIGRLGVNVSKAEVYLIQMLASAFVMSWSGVIRIHGIRPTPRPGHPAGVFVANHSSMIDFIVLLQSHPYAVIGQKHPGWVGLLQDSLLKSLQCVWFDRGRSTDRAYVAECLREHSHNPDKASCPLLVFPEGTCVNNEHVVLFKKGVFELGVPINPIAIKYNKVFVDAFWNSREQSFAQHLIRLMTSWAVVCDVWFLDPQTIRPGERPEDFAQRVQTQIAARAGLKVVEWDGYMKYWKPSQRFIAARQKAVADELCAMLGIDDSQWAAQQAQQQAATAQKQQAQAGGEVADKGASAGDAAQAAGATTAGSQPGDADSAAASSADPSSGDQAAATGTGKTLQKRSVSFDATAVADPQPPSGAGTTEPSGTGSETTSTGSDGTGTGMRMGGMGSKTSLGSASAANMALLASGFSSFPDGEAQANGDGTSHRIEEAAARAFAKHQSRRLTADVASLRGLSSGLLPSPTNAAGRSGAGMAGAGSSLASAGGMRSATQGFTGVATGTGARTGSALPSPTNASAAAGASSAGGARAPSAPPMLASVSSTSGDSTRSLLQAPNPLAPGANTQAAAASGAASPGSAALLATKRLALLGSTAGSTRFLHGNPHAAPAASASASGGAFDIGELAEEGEGEGDGEDGEADGGNGQGAPASASGAPESTAAALGSGTGASVRPRRSVRIAE